VKNDSFAAVVTVPNGYSTSLKSGQPIALEILIKQNNNNAYLIETEVKQLSNRMVQSAKISHTLVKLIPGLPFEESLKKVNNAWRNAPLVVANQIVTSQQKNPNGMSAAQTAPGMMLQFSLAGLLTAGQMIVNERKSRVFQRLLTTATSRSHILFGHYFAILALVFVQFMILILFGQFIMGLDYLNQALPTFLLMLACAICIAAIGLLIGMLAKTDDQAIIFALIPMFIFSGLGGAWMPLEFTGKTFQTIGHLSPVAWGMDGFKAILTSNAGLETIWLPVIVLFGYGVLFFIAAAFMLKTKQN
jgi:ABC-2 type transport system permease protein